MNALLKTCLAFALLLATASPATALSWPLCSSNTGGSVWVTERPRTGPQFPGANLFYFCDEGLNILGASIDPCVNNGATCTPAIADAICTLLGYERAYTADFNVSRAEPDEVVMSLTGEYCVREGVYAAKAPSPEELAAAQGTPCNKISSISCIRTIDTMATALALGIQQAELTGVKAAPAAEDLDATAQMAEEQAIPLGQKEGGGRKLLRA